MSTTQENKAIVRRFLEGPGSGGDPAAMDELFGPNYRNHGLGGNVPPMGLDDAKRFAQGFFAAFPDARAHIEEMVAEGDRVATRYTFTGTHKGDLQGIPASGKQVCVSGISLHRLQGGKIVEDWPGVDMLGLLQQIGAAPAPPTAGSTSAHPVPDPRRENKAGDTISIHGEGTAASTEENKALSRRFLAESDRQNFDAAWTLLARDYVAHSAGAPGPLDAPAFRYFAGMFYAAFPDGYHTIEDQIAEGVTVVTRLTWHGTHQGDFQGIPPTGKRVATTGMAIHRIAGGAIAEAWMEFDSLGLMQQLGVAPAAAEATR